MLSEFKEFINKGNVIDAAVGLIMALAFLPVVQGLVDFIIMPIVARILGQPDFSEVRIGLGGDPLLDAEGAVIADQAYIEVGNWINTIVSFLLIAFVVFMMVRAYNKATKQAEEEEDDGPSEVDLLTEIRDNLSARG